MPAVFAPTVLLVLMAIVLYRSPRLGVAELRDASSI
jgi:hypothetical protein